MKQIIEAGRDLYLNQNTTVCCPFCEKSRADRYEKSLSITRIEAGFLYICFRAKCTAHGIISENPIPGRIIPAQKTKFKSKYITRPLVYIPEDVYKDMLGKYGISIEDVKYQEFRWDKEDCRLYAPIRSHMEYVIGGVAKVQEKGRKPKVIGYRHSEVPFIHFPRGQTPTDTLVLVEDFISATKVAKIQYCAALLGTNLTENVFSYLKKEVGINHIILLLDFDAKHKAIKIKKKYSPRMDINIISLKDNRDPKALNMKELREILI